MIYFLSAGFTIGTFFYPKIGVALLTKITYMKV